ncbi:MAG: hypothetical protein JKY01_00515 [Pseudomonadales bacterium]|nr:hypothetical protein [Pseudomonadales bacterium]
MKYSSKKGFALPMVIFFLVIVSGIVTMMAKLSANQAGSTALSIQSARAYYAAKSGVEWAAYQIDANPTWCSSGSLNLTGGLNGFTVSVSCSALNTYVEGGKSISMYEISSVASSGVFASSPDYVYRKIIATLTTEN